MAKTDSGIKSKWKRIAFGEAVQNIAERADPTPEDSARYIGLEHLDAGSLTVRRWGSDRALEGQKLRMRRGDVLFARRNAYLRRVAVAPHDGLFSAHGLVLRARESVMLHEFLPYFMQSDVFMDRAIGISVGSLSPTVNWRDLAQQEFTLPPIEEQRRSVWLLQAIDRSAEALVTLGVCNTNVARALVSAQAIDRVGSVSDFAERVSKGTTPRHLGKSYVTSGIPFLRGEDLQNAEVVPGSVTHCIDAETDQLLSRSRLQPGDVLVSIAGTIGRVGLVGSTAPAMNCNQAVAFIRPRNAAHSVFLFHWLQTGVVQNVIQQQTVTGTIPNLSLEMLKSLPVPLWSDAQRTGFTQSCEAHAFRAAQIHKRREVLRAIKAHASSTALGAKK